MKNEQKRGFTLIELLVVIAIIGLLASIVLASLNSARKKSRDARRVADMKQMQNALELYANDNAGTYPTAAGDTALQVTLSAASAPGLTPTYIASLPVDPVTGSNYRYRTSAVSNATNYCVGTALEGGSLSNTASSTCQAAVQLITGVAGSDNGATAPLLLNYAVGN
jgi:type II secretion system protein G